MLHLTKRELQELIDLLHELQVRYAKVAGSLETFADFVAGLQESTSARRTRSSQVPRQEANQGEPSRDLPGQLLLGDQKGPSQ